MNRLLVVFGLTGIVALLFCCAAQAPRAEALSFGINTQFVDYAIGANPFFVVVGDFNGDGKLDLAVANTIGNTVSVLLGNGSGGFGAKTDFATGTTPWSRRGRRLQRRWQARPGRGQLRQPTPSACCWATATAALGPRRTSPRARSPFA